MFTNDTTYDTVLETLREAYAIRCKDTLVRALRDAQELSTFELERFEMYAEAEYDFYRDECYERVAKADEATDFSDLYNLIDVVFDNSNSEILKLFKQAVEKLGSDEDKAYYL